MSIIAALISDRDGVVGSDWRMFSSVWLESGQAVHKAEIESDEFDKTFALNNGQVIGAFAGLMRFSGEPVSAHISEAVRDSITQIHDLAMVAKLVQHAMVRRLEEIDQKEVVFTERKLDVLLAAGESLSRTKMRIMSLRFIPDGDHIVAELETVGAKANNRYYLRGNSQAITAAKDVFAKTVSSRRDAVSLQETIAKAIKVGIDAASICKYGSDQECGGKVFSRRTFYA